MIGKPFAKLFEVDGVDQVLVTLIENDVGNAACGFRIPDACGCFLQLSTSLHDVDDYEKQEAFAQKLFDDVSSENIMTHIEPILKARDTLFRDGQ